MRFSRRQLDGLAIVATGGMIERLTNRRFVVRTGKVEETWTVAWKRNRWRCVCDDFKRRGKPCAHVFAVLYMLDLPNLILLNTGGLERLCPFCGSKDIVRNGCNRNLGGPVQTYLCNACKKRFRLSLDQEARGANSWIMLLALDLFNKGLSLRDIQDHLWQLYGIRKPTSTLHVWILKLTKMATKAGKTIKPEVGMRWLGDEMIIKVKGKPSYLWNILDYKTRHHIVSILAKGRGEDEAYRALMQAIRKVGHAPAEFVSDGLASYPPAVQKIRLLNDRLRHVKDVGIADKASNNRIERRHNGIRGWTRTKRGMKGRSQELIDGNRVYYNHVRPHMRFGGRPPSPISGSNRWTDLLRLGRAANKRNRLTAKG